MQIISSWLAFDVHLLGVQCLWTQTNKSKSSNQSDVRNVFPLHPGSRNMAAAA